MQAVALLGAVAAALTVAVGVLAWRLHQLAARQAATDARMNQLGLVKEMIDDAREQEPPRRRGMWVVSVLVALVCL